MRKFDQIDGDVTLTIMLGRDAVKIIKADDWYEIEATTVSNRRLVTWFTVLNDEGEVPEEIINVMSVDDFYGDGETSHVYVREWLRNNANAGNIYVQHYIHAYGMDESKIFAAFLGRECTTEE